jgi:Concanavalin A-like lectin/glucanases superfamily/Protein of unknown function (DUF3168)
MAFPLAGLAAFYPLDEPSGTRHDAHGSFDLDEQNGVGWAPGRDGLGARFQQVNSQALTHMSNPPLDTGDVDFTITAWINPASPGQMIVIGKDAGSGRDYWLEVSANQRARFGCQRSNKSAAIESTGPTLDVGAWAFLVASYDASAQTIAIQVNDGPVESASTSAVPLNDTGTTFQIGTRAGAAVGEHFDGVIDLVGVWTRRLLPAEASALWNGGAGLPYPPRPPLVSALRDRLLMLPAVAEKVGTRIYTLTFPQSLTAPALRLQEIDRVSEMHLRGVVEIVRARVQVDAVEANHHSDPYARAHALAQAVRGSVESGAASGLAGFRGELSGIPISGILADDQRERYDAETQMVRIEQDFIVWFHV